MHRGVWLAAYQKSSHQQTGLLFPSSWKIKVFSSQHDPPQAFLPVVSNSRFDPVPLEVLSASAGVIQTPAHTDAGNLDSRNSKRNAAAGNRKDFQSSPLQDWP